jgi:rhodanese-related sulfurtransferase
VRAIVVAAIVALGLGACSSGQSSERVSIEPTTPPPVDTTTSSAVQLVDVAKATTLVADPSVVVIDVRTPGEFAEGHIDRAQVVDFNAPGFRDRIAQFDRSATYLVYCHSGNRSGQATAMMAELGFTKVYDLAGGIPAWQGAGGPIVK